MAESLMDALRAYDKTYYPLHMPGHKRRLDPSGGLPISIDITEVDGMDDLHNASGILAEAEARTAALYGSPCCRYLVGGSTVGILSAIRACCSRNGTVLAARNCHKSVWHAAELMNLTTAFLMPERIGTFDLFGSVRPEEVAGKLRKHPEAEAVVITSPTYEGVLSDVRAIAEICHAAGVPLIVDEAHGAHLGLRAENSSDRAFFPQGAVSCGADVVIQSAHKTLPCLTQTSWMHIQGNLVSPKRVDHELDVFETSSPSYPLMASLDAATCFLTREGGGYLHRWEECLAAFAEKTRGLRYLRIPGITDPLPRTAAFARDPGKILISGRDAGLTGGALANILRTRYQFETEMAVGWNVLAMTSMADDPEAIERFAEALQEIDSGSLYEKEPPFPRRLSASDIDIVIEANLIAAPSAETVMTIAEAMERPSVPVIEESAAGAVSAEYLWAYPPGIPLIMPGERITDGLLCTLRALRAAGTAIHHEGRAHDSVQDGMILTVKAEKEDPKKEQNRI